MANREYKTCLWWRTSYKEKYGGDKDPTRFLQIGKWNFGSEIELFSLKIEFRDPFGMLEESLKRENIGKSNGKRWFESLTNLSVEFDVL